MIPFNVIPKTINELPYLQTAVLQRGNTDFRHKLETAFASFVGSKHALATATAAQALQVAMKTLGVRREDLVIVPNMVSVMQIHAVKSLRASPIMIDVNTKTWTIDVKLLEWFLHKECSTQTGECIHESTERRVKAIVVAHHNGNLAEMGAIMKLAKKFHLVVVEQCSEALGSFYNGKHAGLSGHIGVFGFEGDNLIDAGTGGILFSDNEEYIKNAQRYFLENAYRTSKTGFAVAMPEVNAALALAQLENIPELLDQRKQIYQHYKKTLASVKSITLQTEYEKPMFSRLVCLSEYATDMLEHLRVKGIEAKPIYAPLNRVLSFANDQYMTDQNVAVGLWLKGVCLPFHPLLTAAQIEQVKDVLEEFFFIKK